MSTAVLTDGEYSAWPPTDTASYTFVYELRKSKTSFFLFRFLALGGEARTRQTDGIRRFSERPTFVRGGGHCFRLARTVRRDGRRLSSDNTACVPTGGAASSVISVHSRRSPTSPSPHADRSGLSAAVCSADVFFFSYFLFFRRHEPDSEPNKIGLFFFFNGANAGERKNVLPAVTSNGQLVRKRTKRFFPHANRPQS